MGSRCKISYPYMFLCWIPDSNQAFSGAALSVRAFTGKSNHSNFHKRSDIPRTKSWIFQSFFNLLINIRLPDSLHLRNHLVLFSEQTEARISYVPSKYIWIHWCICTKKILRKTLENIINDVGNALVQNNWCLLMSLFQEINDISKFWGRGVCQILMLLRDIIENNYIDHFRKG